MSKLNHGLTAGMIALLSGFAASAADMADNPATQGFALYATPDGGEPVTLTTPPPIALKAAGLNIALERTTLTDITKTFGGEIVHAKPGTEESIYLVCYTSADALTWFISSEFFSDTRAVQSVLVERLPATVPAECVKPTTDLALSTGLPGIEAAPGDVAKAMGVPSLPATDIVTAMSMASDAKGTVTRSATYRFDAGHASAVLIGQTTEQ